MITLKPNANATIARQIPSEGVFPFYVDTCEKYMRGIDDPFATALQILFVKIGRLVASVDQGHVPDVSYCLGCMRYLCKRVLDDGGLFNEFQRLGINDSGNKGKHEIRDISLDIEGCVRAYNTMMQKLVDRYELVALKGLILKKSIPSKPVATPAPEPPREPSHKPSREPRHPHGHDVDFTHPLAVADRRLRTNLPNSTYPLAKKIGDVRAQLNALKAESDAVKSMLDLKYNEVELMSWLRENEPLPSETKPKAKKKPDERSRYTLKASASDELAKLTVTSKKGYGLYNAGLFHRKPKLNFTLKIQLTKKEETTTAINIGKTTITVEVDGVTTVKEIPERSFGQDLPIDVDGADSFAKTTVVCEYRFGRFGRRKKKLTVTVGGEY